jgi:hypothetical protein
LRAVSDANRKFRIRVLRAGAFEVEVLVRPEGKPTDIVDATPKTAPVELKTQTDSAAGVRFVIRRAPKP